MRCAKRGAPITSSAAIRMTPRWRWIISCGSRKVRNGLSSSTPALPRRWQRSAAAFYLRDPIDALKLVGVDADKIQDVILTHLHYDHVGNFHRFPAAQFHLQEPEMHYATGRYMRYPRLAHSFEVEDVVGMVRLNFAKRVVFYDGGAELAPGITLHPVGGHSVGLQFARVHTRRGWVVVASDTTHFYENMMTGRPFTTAFHIGKMLEAFDTLRAAAPTPQHIVPGHDPLVMKFYPPPSAALAGIVARLDVTPDDAALAAIKT
jgi:glyoxylase-like metal-dependent hydrolase (beta-lactamase superfamily II)